MRRAAKTGTVRKNHLFPALCLTRQLPRPVAEHRFHPTRKWKFDFAWPDQKLALEVEGGVWIGGRHTSGAGFVKDMEKYNAATCAGWRLLRVQPNELYSMETATMIRTAICP